MTSLKKPPFEIALQDNDGDLRAFIRNHAPTADLEEEIGISVVSSHM